MRHICGFCGAKHFLCEKTGSTIAQPMFSNCCYKGKVQLPPIRRYPPHWIGLLEYRRLAKPCNKRKREETHHTHLSTSTTDLQACNTQHAQGERCPVLQYLTALANTQVQYEFDNWIDELKQQAICKRSAKSAAKLRIQSTGKLPQTWSYKQYWQHMRWYSQEPRIVAYLYGPQEHIK